VARAYVGTSGFGYKEWRPSFYPAKLSEKEFLPYYASKFGAVEIDYTFYRLPNVATLEKWRDSTPSGFKFAIKASQRITHFERLQLPSDSFTYFTSILPKLADRLATELYQLPPYFKVNLPRFESFLANLPKDQQATFEFRNASWFVDDVYQLMRDNKIALCVNEGDDGCTPLELTAPFSYVRLRKSAYTPAEREAWQARIREWVSGGADVVAFIKHEDNPDAPHIALEFAKGLVDG